MSGMMRRALIALLVGVLATSALGAGAPPQDEEQKELAGNSEHDPHVANVGNIEEFDRFFGQQRGADERQCFVLVSGYGNTSRESILAFNYERAH